MREETGHTDHSNAPSIDLHAAARGPHGTGGDVHLEAKALAPVTARRASLMVEGELAEEGCARRDPIRSRPC